MHMRKKLKNQNFSTVTNRNNYEKNRIFLVKPPAVRIDQSVPANEIREQRRGPLIRYM